MELTLLTMLAMSSTQLLVAAGWLIGLLVAVGVLWWLVDYFGAPAPLNKLLKGVLIIVALIILVLFIFHVVGKPPF